jgi:hypothetical protein
MKGFQAVFRKESSVEYLVMMVSPVCETWEEHTSSVFKKTVLRRGSNRTLKKLHNGEVHNWYTLPYIITYSMVQDIL